LRPRPSARAVVAALVAAGIGSLAAGSAVSASVGAPGRWSQYQSDAEHTGFSAAAPAAPFRLVWSRPTAIGDETHFAGIPAPVIAGDDVVVVDRDDVSGLSLSTGAVAWSVPRQLGPSSPAAVSEDGATIVYAEGGGDRSSSASSSPSVTSTSPAPPTGSASPAAAAAADRSTLVAIDATSRHVLWRTALPGVSAGGPTVDGSTVLVGTDDGSVTAVDLATGDQEWTVDLGEDVNTPIAVSDGLAYVAIDQGSGEPAVLLALREADHSPLWRYEMGAGVSIGTPALAGGTVYATVGDGSVRAIDAATGQARWAAKLNTVSGGGSPAVSGDAVVVVDIRGQVYRFAASTGARVWDFAMNAPVYASPAIAGTSVVVADATGDVSAIDLESGQRIWRGNVGAGLPLGLAVTPDTIVASRTGAAAGVVGLAADPQGVLIHEQSPTIVRPAALGLSWIAAAIPLVLLLVGAGRFLDRRLGPPVFEESENALEPEDDDA
jgi:eukaryotic-like serine/threonine-protein kinase